MKIIGLPKKEALIMTVDPAGGGKGYTFVYIREGSDLLHTSKFKCDHASEAVREVSKRIYRHSPDIVLIDNGGFGKYFEDALQREWA